MPSHVMPAQAMRAPSHSVARDLARLAIPLVLVAGIIAGALWLDRTTFFIVEEPGQASTDSGS
jgi:hypothetical protein